MARKLKISIGGIPFVAELLEDEAPETCKAFLGALPIRGKVIQARWSGEAAWLPMDEWGIEAPFENHTSHPSRGDLLYYPGARAHPLRLGPLQQQGGPAPGKPLRHHREGSRQAPGDGGEGPMGGGPGDSHRGSLMQ